MHAKKNPQEKGGCRHGDEDFLKRSDSFDYCEKQNPHTGKGGGVGVGGHAYLQVCTAARWNTAALTPPTGGTPPSWHPINREGGPADGAGGGGLLPLGGVTMET